MGVAGRNIPQRWKRRTRASGRSAEETSSEKHLYSLLNYLADREAIRNVLLLHGLGLYLFTYILLWCDALLISHLRCMGALVRNIMAQRLRELFSVVRENLCIVSAA